MFFFLGYTNAVSPHLSINRTSQTNRQRQTEAGTQERRQTDRQTDRQTGRQAGRQTNWSLPGIRTVISALKKKGKKIKDKKKIKIKNLPPQLSLWSGEPSLGKDTGAGIRSSLKQDN